MVQESETAEGSPLARCPAFSAGTVAVLLCWLKMLEPVRAEVEMRPLCAVSNDICMLQPEGLSVTTKKVSVKPGGRKLLSIREQ